MIQRLARCTADKHDGFSTIPPSTALYSERRIVATKCAVISPNAIPDWPLLTQSGHSSKSRLLIGVGS
jgi:hypothetical protein